MFYFAGVGGFGGKLAGCCGDLGSETQPWNVGGFLGGGFSELNKKLYDAVARPPSYWPISRTRIFYPKTFLEEKSEIVFRFLEKCAS